MDPPVHPAPGEGAPDAAVPLRRFGADARVYYRAGSGLEERAEEVVRDSAAWHALWSRIVDRYSPKPAAPEVDFGREMVLVAAMGQRPTGGYEITIESVTETGAELVAVVTHQQPGPRCFNTQAFTAPADLVAIPRSEKPVRWTVREVVKDCP
jgi:hypothetical protein